MPHKETLPLTKRHILPQKVYFCLIKRQCCSFVVHIHHFVPHKASCASPRRGCVAALCDSLKPPAGTLRLTRILKEVEVMNLGWKHQESGLSMGGDTRGD